MENKTNELGEARAIEFTSYTDDRGFERHITIRGMSGTEVMGKMDLAITYILENGGKPLVKPQGYGKNATKPPLEYVEGKLCPNDQGRLIKGQGKVKEKCENNKYDPVQKKAIGCTYVVWNES